MQHVQFMYSTCTRKTFVFIIATKHSIAKFLFYFEKSVCMRAQMYMFVHSCTCIVVYENTSRTVVQIMYVRVLVPCFSSCTVYM